MDKLAAVQPADGDPGLKALTTMAPPRNRGVSLGVGDRPTRCRPGADSRPGPGSVRHGHHDSGRGAFRAPAPQCERGAVRQRHHQRRVGSHMEGQDRMTPPRFRLGCRRQAVAECRGHPAGRLPPPWLWCRSAGCMRTTTIWSSPGAPRWWRPSCPCCFPRGCRCRRLSAAALRGGLPLSGHHGVPFPAAGRGLGRCHPELVDTADRLSAHAQHLDLRGASGGARPRPPPPSQPSWHCAPRWKVGPVLAPIGVLVVALLFTGERPLPSPLLITSIICCSVAGGAGPGANGLLVGPAATATTVRSATA